MNTSETKFDPVALRNSARRQAGSGGNSRYQQRFLAQRSEDGSSVTLGKSSLVSVFVEVAPDVAAEHNNPWWTFGEFWQAASDKFKQAKPEWDADQLRAAMRGVWSKMSAGYGLMEKRPVPRKAAGG